MLDHEAQFEIGRQTMPEGIRGMLKVKRELLATTNRKIAALKELVAIEEAFPDLWEDNDAHC